MSLNLDKIGAMRRYFYFFLRNLPAMFQPGENTSHSYEPLQQWYTAQEKKKAVTWRNCCDIAASLQMSGEGNGTFFKGQFSSANARRDCAVSPWLSVSPWLYPLPCIPFPVSPLPCIPLTVFPSRSIPASQHPMYFNETVRLLYTHVLFSTLNWDFSKRIVDAIMY